MRYDPPPGGTPLDPDELADLIPRLSTLSELNEFEARNISLAITWVARHPKFSRMLLTSDGLFELHQRMFDQTWKWAGWPRSTEKNIGVPPWKIPTAVVELCADVNYWLQHQTYGLDEIGARFHHRLVSIHPFPNGNGRHARLATDLLIEREGAELFTWGFSLGSDARAKYLEALRAADLHDFASLIQFVRL